MASLYVTEYSGLSYAGHHSNQLAQAPATQAITAYQKVAISGSTAQSAALQGTTTFVKLISDTACWLAYGANPTATTSSDYLPAGAIMYATVQSASKIAAITA